MTPRYKNKRFQLFHAKSEVLMKKLPSNSVHAIVCDPPYELGFMGKSWDSSGIAYNVEMWKEALRVLKPGGHLLAFSGSRTYHRMVVAIEDAGFEIRDQIMWVYGSGFPKSQNVGKAIDKAAGAERKVIGVKKTPDGKAYTDRRPANKDGEGWDRPWKNDEEKWQQQQMLTAPATPEAAEWEGWGTALKPSHEPICVARKPFKGTVANNVLKHRTGAFNIDASRIETSDKVVIKRSNNHGSQGGSNGWGKHREKQDGSEWTQRSGDFQGRWPANLIHDGSDEVTENFPVTTSGGGPKPGTKRTKVNTYNEPTVSQSKAYGSSTGSAARFFYCAKASRSDRGKDNDHPTVKPIDLMRYLVRLVTPPDGIVLDPFMGSGSTGKAAMLEGFKFAGIEMKSEYLDIAYERIKQAYERYRSAQST